MTAQEAAAWLREKFTREVWPEVHAAADHLDQQAADLNATNAGIGRIAKEMLNLYKDGDELRRELSKARYEVRRLTRLEAEQAQTKARRGAKMIAFVSRPTWEAGLLFDPHGFWLGSYWNAARRRLCISIIPMLPFCWRRRCSK